MEQTPQYTPELYRTLEGFDLSDLEVVRLILRGDSVLDWHHLNLTHEEAEAFCRVHRIDPDIPEDISLLGCDNSQHAEYFCPPLSVIDIPNDRLGYAAATWVHQRLQKQGSEHPPVEPWMQGSLIIRATTAPPRK